MRLNQVTAPAIDLDASIAFYQLLGLKLIVKSPHYARFELPRGEATFSLHLVEGDIPRSHAPVLYFETHMLDDEVARLKAAGVIFEHELIDQPWLWREAGLRDPAGNMLKLYWADTNRRYPPWRIDQDAGPENLHIVFLEDGMKLVKRSGDDWRALQDDYPTYKASLGPYDLFGVIETLEFDWASIIEAKAHLIRAFVSSMETEMDL
jgi:catechol 2,3-dioxygenase-like lactoylglutathione lyase family enzyme